MILYETDVEHPITIPCNEVHLEGLLHIPYAVTGMVIFVHGSGSSRFSKRNKYVASIMQHANFATLLFDLLTAEEDEIDEKTMELRFDIDLLSSRLLAVTHWLLQNPLIQQLPFGYFGASTGAGAALLAAKDNPYVKAIVSRGGRPDLAGADALKQVKAPTLLIVGGNDEPVISLNQKAYDQLTCVKKLEIIEGATHLFEEAGKLDVVAQLTQNWFKEYLP